MDSTGPWLFSSSCALIWSVYFAVVGSTTSSTVAISLKMARRVVLRHGTPRYTSWTG